MSSSHWPESRPKPDLPGRPTYEQVLANESMWCAEQSFRSSAYTSWLQRLRAAYASTPPWPEFRDAWLAKQAARRLTA